MNVAVSDGVGVNVFVGVNVGVSVGVLVGVSGGGPYSSTRTITRGSA